MCVTRGIPNRQYPMSGLWVVAIIADSVTRSVTVADYRFSVWMVERSGDLAGPAGICRDLSGPTEVCGGLWGPAGVRGDLSGHTLWDILKPCCGARKVPPSSGPLAPGKILSITTRTTKRSPSWSYAQDGRTALLRTLDCVDQWK